MLDIAVSVCGAVDHVSLGYESTVGDLRYAIAQKSGLAEESCKLMAGAHELHDNTTRLADVDTFDMINIVPSEKACAIATLCEYGIKPSDFTTKLREVCLASGSVSDESVLLHLLRMLLTAGVGMQSGCFDAMGTFRFGEMVHVCRDTPVHSLIRRGKAAALRLFLRREDTRVYIAAYRNCRGESYLIFAARKGSADCVAALLDAGCDVTAASLQGHTPASVARAAGNTDILEELSRSGALL